MTTEARTNVPFIDLARLTARVRARALHAFGEVLDAQAFVGGEQVQKLEQELGHALATPHAIACANGTDALRVGLQALGVRAGMRVALPNLTFWASYEAVVQLGATPVLLDIDAEDLQLSFDALEAAQRAQALDGCLFVHLFGWSSARLWDIRGFCGARGIRLLEDGAQAYGVLVDGVPVLGSAEIATTSFYPAKVLGGCVDGGAVFTRSEELARSVRALCNHGRTAHYAHDRVGWNSRMGGLAAAYLREVLAIDDDILEARRRAAALYREALASRRDVRCFSAPPGQLDNGYLNVLGLRDPEAVAHVTRALTDAGIGYARTYPIPLDAQPGAQAATRSGDLSNSRAFCARVLNLPLFFGITDREQRAALDALCHALDG